MDDQTGDDHTQSAEYTLLLIQASIDTCSLISVVSLLLGDLPHPVLLFYISKLKVPMVGSVWL